MADPILYRKRLIPDECVLLKDDVILYRDDQMIVTGWHTLKPRKDLHHGCSCYYLSEGFKISRFYREDDSMLFWYCDIVDHTFDMATDTYIFTDLLVDVIVYPDGFVKVVDLDEPEVPLANLREIIVNPEGRFVYVASILIGGSAAAALIAMGVIFWKKKHVNEEIDNWEFN